jgi:hypothetical protein
MNREWHAGHKMPEKATERQRIEWHLEHAKACGCRPVPLGLVGKMSEGERRKIRAGLAKGKQ